MRMPQFVTLLTQRIAVVRVEGLHHPSEPNEFGESHAHRAYGVYEEATQVISIDKGLKFERARETFLHENLHAMLAMNQVDSLLEGQSQGLGEHVVSATAPVLLAWMRDNPAAVAWLQEVQS